MRRRAVTKRMIKLNSIPSSVVATLEAEQTTTRPETAVANLHVDVAQQRRKRKAKRGFRVTDLCGADGRKHGKGLASRFGGGDCQESQPLANCIDKRHHLRPCQGAGVSELRFVICRPKRERLFLSREKCIGCGASPPPPSFRDAPLGAGPESITPAVVMDSGLARRCAPRNDGASPSATLALLSVV